VTPLYYVVLVLLLVLACAFVCVIWALDAADDRRAAGAYRSTWSQRRAWAKERREAGFR
jgi:hypothetical protein